MSNLKPWCCKIECKSDATWTLYVGDAYENDTQSCDTHAGVMIGSEPLRWAERMVN